MRLATPASPASDERGAEGAARSRGLRTPGGEDPGGVLHGRLLQSHALCAYRGRPPPAGADAGLSEEGGGPRRHGRGDRDLEALLARVERARRACPLRPVSY